jgi:hypothetical protein
MDRLPNPRTLKKQRSEPGLPSLGGGVLSQML